MIEEAVDSRERPPEQLLHPRVVARTLAITVKKVRVLVALDELDGVRTSKRGLRITESSVRRFIEKHRV
jgi:hypothetical protein